MKARVLIFSLLLFFGFAGNAQNLTRDQDSTHDQRIAKLHEARLQFLIQNLKLTPTEETPFRELYQQYQDSRSNVFRAFSEKFHGENLTEEQTKEKIYAGFDVSEKLLNVQRSYTEKFLKVITPKQLNRMFRLEKVMSSQIMERRLKEEQK